MSGTNYRELGNTFFKEKNYEEAAKMYSRGIEAENDEIQASVLYNNRAACYLQLGKFAQAESDATRSIGRQETAKGHLRLARAIASQGGRKAEALSSYEKAAALEPTNETYKKELEEYRTSPEATNTGFMGSLAKNKQTFFYLDMGVIVCAFLHMICLLLSPGTAMMLWKGALVVFALRQIMGIAKSPAGFPSINMQFFSAMTSTFHGQFLILCIVLLVTFAPPMHLLLFAFCIYCLIDMLDHFKSDLDLAVSRLPGFARNIVEPKIANATGNEGRQHLLINATACEVMSVPFSLLGGGGFMTMFILAQFVKWRYQTDAFVKRTFTMIHAALLQLTTHQYCPSFVRPLYEKFAALLERYGGQ